MEKTEKKEDIENLKMGLFQNICNSVRWNLITSSKDNRKPKAPKWDH